MVSHLFLINIGKIYLNGIIFLLIAHGFTQFKKKPVKFLDTSIFKKNDSFRFSLEAFQICTALF